MTSQLPVRIPGRRLQLSANLKKQLSGSHPMSEEHSLQNKSLYDRFLDVICTVCTVFTGVAMVVPYRHFRLAGVWPLCTQCHADMGSSSILCCSSSISVFFGASIGVHQKTHLGVAVFKEISPRPVQALFEFLSYTLMTGFGIIMAIYGYKLTVFKWDALIPLINISEGVEVAADNGERSIHFSVLDRPSHSLLQWFRPEQGTITGGIIFMGLVILLGLFAFGVVIGMPVAFALGVAAVSAFIYEGLPLMIAFQRILAGISIYSLMAIPFFIFAGELMFHGGIAIRLVRLASAAVGAMRGGLGVVNVLSSMLFGGISGSAIADVSALGSILIPVMKEKGYDDDYAGECDGDFIACRDYYSPEP